MTLPLDHIVIQVADLEATITDYTALGFTVQRGGTHADGLTHNALVGFADGSYLELIAFLRDVPGRRWWELGRAHGDGFVDFALLPPSVGEVVERARRGGVAYSGPLDGGRVRPDGHVLQWQIGQPPSHDLPFLCGDITPREGRVREGAVRAHANGVLGVGGLTLAVADVDQSLVRYRALLGDAAVLQAAAPLAGTGLRVAAVALRGATLVLLGPGVGEAPAGLALRERLARRGEGLYGVALASAAGTPPRHFDPSATHGAWFEISARVAP